MTFSRRILLFAMSLLCTICMIAGDIDKARAAKDGYDYYHEWATKNLASGGKDVPNDVRGKLDEFVDGVKKAWEEEHAAKDRTDVIDLGQSLHLLETKFGKLKDTIFKQFIDTKGSGDGKASASTEEIEKVTSEIVHKIIDQQGHVGEIQSNVDRLEETVNSMTNSLVRLEKDIAKATNMMEQLDSSQEAARNAADKHYDSLTRHGDHIEDLTLNGRSSHTMLYYFVVLEMVGLALFAYIRRRNAKKNKYDKMG